jgi:hypothetical protein
MELNDLVRSPADRLGNDIPVLVTRTHSAELELEAIVGHHVLLCVRVIGAVHTHGIGFCWRWWGWRRSSRRCSLLPPAQSWIGSHSEYGRTILGQVG